ncbi:hypothetical protein FHW58_000290 [Duganella sp. 1224]|uniref:hypothetical protein n=1 Tax=Duganella sp. 1224 TaxID=2587052 RepID=UPI0015CAFC78|nr:hypothetical protein [Duganella sp. 1224]NYE59138.1 hypothetical protein [Duganella sp. 1224]
MTRNQMLLLWPSIVMSSVLAASAGIAADLPAQPTAVVIGKDKIQALGTSVQTPEALVKLLEQNKVQHVRLRPEADVGNDFERIGAVIYTIARSGIKMEGIDRQETKDGSGAVK